MTDGYRDHSGAQKNLANAKLGVRIDEASKFSRCTSIVWISKQMTQVGLTKAEWKANPQQAPREYSMTREKPSSKLRLGCAMNVA